MVKFDKIDLKSIKIIKIEYTQVEYIYICMYVVDKLVGKSEHNDSKFWPKNDKNDLNSTQTNKIY